MARNPETQYKLVRPKDADYRLTVPQQLDILNIVSESVAKDFPERSLRELKAFQDEAQKVRRNPNAAVGGPLFRRQQKFARPLSVLAIRGDSVVAHLPVAKNASSSQSGLYGQLEIEGKLKLPTLDAVSHRYMWLGYAAIGTELRAELADTSPEEANPLDVMINLASSQHKAIQPVSAYPWANEKPWMDELASIGLQYQAGSDEEVYAFGEDFTPVIQQWWKAETVQDVQVAIANKAGGEAAVAEAWLNLQ